MTEISRFFFQSPHHRKIKLAKVHFPFSPDNTGGFQKRRMKQETFSSLPYIGNSEKAIPATARRKKSRKPFSDFLLGVPLHGGGYSVVGLSVKPELK